MSSIQSTWVLKCIEDGYRSRMEMQIAAPTTPHFSGQNLQQKPTYLLFDAPSDRL